MVLGPIKGIPYKIFATTSHGLGISYIAFVLASIPARSIRFLAVTLISWTIGKYAFKKLSSKSKYIIWGISWLIIYVIYFFMHPS